MQHIIARQNDTVTLCGQSRDRIVQSGNTPCPDCFEMDRLIQESIRLIRDPTHGARMKDLIHKFTEIAVPYAPKTKAQLTAKENVKMDYKSSAVKALKRGAASGAMKVLSKKVKAKLTEKFPALAMVPPDVWNVLLCLAVNMTASAMPDMPGIAAAEKLTSEAFEGLLTDATSKMVQDVIETVSETVMEIAEAQTKKPKELAGYEE